ncbi:hypothetical protein DL98DRAFT_575954 [Cadophora sp. DSE1049]|nr:hypothetical protein DL98DRAFT_575954 [Cadophora sp. DSE1049]
MTDTHTNDALRPEIMANGSTNEVEEACTALVCPARLDEVGDDTHHGKGNRPTTDPWDTVQITSPPSPLPFSLPGPIIDILRKVTNKRIYVDPLFWETYHLGLLKVHVTLSDATDWQQASLSCADLGKVSRQRLALVLQYPFHSERDVNLTGLVLQTVFSFQERLRKPIFRIQQRSLLPFRFGRLPCPTKPPLLVCDSTAGVPLMAFTHDTNRFELRNNQSYRRTIQRMELEVALPDIKLEIDPHDAAVLIAMAQEAARISSLMAPLQQKPTIFRPVLITPTANREALHVYRASIPQEYLESLEDIRRPLTSEILITRTNLTFDNIPAFLERLGEILDGFPSAHQGIGMSGRAKRKRQVYEEEMQDPQLGRWKRLRGVDIHAELDKMVSEARFGGLQEPVLQAIMKHQSPIVAVLGTGVGKTLLFQLPTESMSCGTTIVISPLVSLQEHMVERCQQAGILCVQGDPRQCHVPSQIIIVTPESVGLHQLDRFVFDECHTVLDSTPEFWPKMQQLGGLVERGVQMVYLTATLPPHIEPEFMNILKIRAGDVHMFRAPTSRPNIAYSVVEYEEDEFRRGDIAAGCELVSHAVGCHAYYRDVGDATVKDAIRQA